MKSFDDFPEFDDCASIATTIPAVKSWYSDIEEDSDCVLQTHFVPERNIVLAPYAESIVDEDDPVVNPTSHIEIVIDDEDPVVDPTPHVEVVIEEDALVDPAPHVEIVINEGVTASESAPDVDVVVAERSVHKEGTLPVKLRPELFVCWFLMLVEIARQNVLAHGSYLNLIRQN